MIQFADETCLILNGSQSSLQAALNTIEIFGSFSGLHMNTNKTKVIWSGRKKYSKDKLKVSVKLDWGTTQFKLLGIIFSVTYKNDCFVCICVFIFILSTITPYTTGLRALFNPSDCTGTVPTDK